MGGNPHVLYINVTGQCAMHLHAMMVVPLFFTIIIVLCPSYQLHGDQPISLRHCDILV